MNVNLMCNKSTLEPNLVELGSAINYHVSILIIAWKFCILLVCCFWTGTLVSRNFSRWQLNQNSSASWLAGCEPPPLPKLFPHLCLGSLQVWAFKTSQSSKWLRRGLKGSLEKTHSADRGLNPNQNGWGLRSCTLINWAIRAAPLLENSCIPIKRVYYLKSSRKEQWKFSILPGTHSTNVTQDVRHDWLDPNDGHFFCLLQSLFALIKKVAWLLLILGPVCCCP